MMNNNKYGISTKGINEYILTKGWMYLPLLCALCFLYILVKQGDFKMSIALGIAPLLAVSFLLILSHSSKAFFVLFGVQFALVAGGMFFEIKTGVTNLVLTLFLTTLLVIYNIYKKMEWKGCSNVMFYSFLVWGVFCIFQITNPNNVQEAWNISIIHYLIYPLACSIMVPLAIKNIKNIEWLLIIWSVFILVATFKGFYQKTYGFNDKELYFLYILGGAKTHIIWSGIRYFSCFSDAANFGVHMAMASVVFGISAVYIGSKGMRIYFVFIALAAIYSMGLSGTRAAIAVPICGVLMFVLLSKSKKYGLIGLGTVIVMVSFFLFTDIGQENQYIRKMRSAFSPSKDASFQVRVQNRLSMKELMDSKPFGYGMGLSKGDRFHPRELMPYPPDSWLVSVWVENGLIGLVLYLVIHGVLFAWCSWLLMFKIMNKQLRGLLAAWLCMNAGFFVSAYVNDVMVYPNPIIVYTAFALCLAGPYIDKRIAKEKAEKAEKEEKKVLETT